MKNYFLMVNEDAVAAMAAIMPHLKFVEILGMNIDTFPENTFLTTPRKKEEVPATPTEDTVIDPVTA